MLTAREQFINSGKLDLANLDSFELPNTVEEAFIPVLGPVFPGIEEG